MKWKVMNVFGGLFSLVLFAFSPRLHTYCLWKDLFPSSDKWGRPSLLDVIPSVVSFALRQDLQVENCRARGSSGLGTALTATRFFSAVFSFLGKLWVVVLLGF